MAIEAMTQPDVLSPGSGVDAEMADFLAGHQRQHSDPVYFHPSRRSPYPDHGRPATALSSMTSQRRALAQRDRMQLQQPLALGGALAASNVDNDAAAARDDSSLDSPITPDSVPRVGQPVDSSTKSTPILHDQAREHQDRAGARPSLLYQNANSVGISRASKPPGTISGTSPSAGPGPGPGPGLGPTKNAQPLHGIQSGSRMPPKQAGVTLTLDKDWKKIRKLQSQISALRSEVQFRRRVLRVKQEAKSIAEDRLMTYLYMKSANDSTIKLEESISAILEDCQRARDEYGPLEDDCTILEDRLSRDEFELTRLWENFYQQIISTDLPEATYTLDLPSTKSDSDSSTTSVYGDDFKVDYHPLVVEFLSKMGDVDILQERLDERREEKDQLEGEKESRELVGLGLAAEDQEWLDNFSALEAELLEDISIAVAEAAKLKQQCYDYGLVDEEGNPTSLENWERQNFSHETDMDAGSESSEFTKFPALLPRYGTTAVQIQDPAPQTNEVVYNPDDRINHWLLRRLLSSPLDVNLLARTYESLFGPIEFQDDWQKRVLTLWYEDGTKRGLHAYRVYSSDGITQTPPPASRQVDTGQGKTRSIAGPCSRDSTFEPKPKSVQSDELLLRGLSSGRFDLEGI